MLLSTSRVQTTEAEDTVLIYVSLFEAVLSRGLALRELEDWDPVLFFYEPAGGN